MFSAHAHIHSPWQLSVLEMGRLLCCVTMEMGLGLSPERGVKNSSVKDQEHGSRWLSVFSYLSVKPMNVTNDSHKSLTPGASWGPYHCWPITILSLLLFGHEGNFITFLNWSMNSSQMPWWVAVFLFCKNCKSDPKKESDGGAYVMD